MFLIAYHRALAEIVSFPAPTHWIDLPSGYEGSRQVALKLLSKNDLFEGAYSYTLPPEASEALRPAITAAEAIGDLPKIDARELVRKGKLKRGARKFDQLAKYDGRRTISIYADAMKNWPGFEAREGIYDHAIRYLPRDYPLLE